MGGLALGGGLVPLEEVLQSVAEDPGLVPTGERLRVRAGVSVRGCGIRSPRSCAREACVRPFFVLVVVGLA